MLHVASAEDQASATHQIDVNGAECTLEVRYGDYSKALSKAVAALKEVRAPQPASADNILNTLLGKEVHG